MLTKSRHTDLFYPPAPADGPFHRFPVRVMGAAAENALSSITRWHVLAVFQSGMYLRSRSGHLVYIGPNGIGKGPLNVLCEFPENMNWLSQGIGAASTAICDGRELAVDARFRFSFTHSMTWRPSVFSTDWSFESLDQGLKIIAAESNRRQPADGFGSLISLITEMPNTPKDIVSPLSLSYRVRKPIESLFNWLKRATAHQGDLSSDLIKRELEYLIGLGPGLTPSGDDFMGGVLIGLHALGHQNTAEELAGKTLSAARHRTNMISFAHLACAAGGQGHAALHQILSAVNGNRMEQLPRRLNLLDTVGHSSGWDAVAGLVLALKASADGFGKSLKTDMRPGIASRLDEERVCQ